MTSHWSQVKYNNCVRIQTQSKFLFLYKMENSYQDDEEEIPSYEESIQQPTTGSSITDTKPKSERGPQQSLGQRLADVRESRINAIINAHINPLLKQQSEAGLFKSTFILVPSNTSTLQSPSSASRDVREGSGDVADKNNTEAVIGFREGEYVKLVRLSGENYTEEFWRQPAVIAELNSSLKARLQNEGHRIAQSPSSPASQPVPTTLLASDPPHTKKGFFGRKKRAGDPVPVAESSTSGWRFEKEEVLKLGEIRIKTGLQDVSLRVQTEMGLYETRTGKAVVVNFEM